MANNTNDSISFSLGDERDLKNLLRDINSSYSVDESCSFEYFNEIKPYDKVQIYCYFNMRKHFFSSYAIFEAMFPELDNRIFKKNTIATFDENKLYKYINILKFNYF